MSAILGIFVFGCFVLAVVALGMTFAFGFLGDDYRSAPAARRDEPRATPADGRHPRLPL